LVSTKPSLLENSVYSLKHQTLSDLSNTTTSFLQLCIRETWHHTLAKPSALSLMQVWKRPLWVSVNVGNHTALLIG